MNSFDLVTLDQVIEHVGNPVEFLKDVACVLKPGGVLIVSTPNVDGWGRRVFRKSWINWHAPYHRHFFSRESMDASLKKSGLVIHSIQTITNSSWLGFQLCHLISQPNEATPSIFWGHSRKRSFLERLSFYCVSILNRLGINAFITRIFDALHLGDNMIFIIKKPLKK